MITEMIENLIGPCPAGMEFLQYIFSFVVVVVGLFVVAYIAHLPFEFISNRFHQ